MAGQIPAGYLADRYGGVPVMIPALLLWSAATMLAPLALKTPNPLVAFLMLRVIMVGAAPPPRRPRLVARRLRSLLKSGFAEIQD